MRVDSLLRDRCRTAQFVMGGSSPLARVRGLFDRASVVVKSRSEMGELLHAESQRARLGFGCAGVARVPSRKQRLRLLELAVGAGYTHFDAAPMYGLGRCEAELGDVLRHEPRTFEVATKFGIEVTPVGRAAGRVQAPLRSLLARVSSAQAGVSQSGADPSSGVVGRVLYDRPILSARQINASLERSLRALGRDRIDLFLLHEPRSVSLWDMDIVRATVALHQRSGAIGRWGFAGDLGVGDLSASQKRSAQVIQCSVGNRATVEGLAPNQQLVLFGAVGRYVQAVRGFIERHPGRTMRLSQALDTDLADAEHVAGLVVRYILDRHPAATVLVSTSRESRVAGLMNQAMRRRAPGENDMVESLIADIKRETGANLP